MAKHSPDFEAQPNRKNGHKVDPAASTEPTSQPVGPGLQVGSKSAGGGDSLNNQAALLSDPRLLHPATSTFRAQIMRSIQERHGNNHVQEVMSRFKDDGHTLSDHQISSKEIDNNSIQRVTGLEDTLPAWVLGETLPAIGTAGGGAAVGGGVAAAAIAAGAIIGGAIGYGAWELEKELFHSGAKTEEVAGIAGTGWAAIAEKLAKKAKANILPEDQQEQLKAGAIAPIRAGLIMLNKPDLNAEAFAASYAGIPEFLDSFAGQAPEGLQDDISSAANQVDMGWTAIKALSLGPKETINRVRGRFDEVSTLASNEVSAVRQLAAQKSSRKSANLPTDEIEDKMELTEAEAAMLQSGAVKPLKTASTQLAGEKPDLTMIMGRLTGVPGLLRSIKFKGPNAASKNSAMDNAAHSISKSLIALHSIVGGEEVAKANAKTLWNGALGKLQGMLKKSKEEPAESPEGE